MAGEYDDYDDDAEGFEFTPLPAFTVPDKATQAKARASRRARHAAQQRWKRKMVLVPGVTPRLPWQNRSLEAQERGLTAAFKGGATHKARIEAQVKAWWDWDAGGVKPEAGTAIRAVVDTYEALEASADKGSMAWAVYRHKTLGRFVYCRSCHNDKPPKIEAEMRTRWETYLTAGIPADDRAAWEDWELRSTAVQDAVDEHFAMVRFAAAQKAAKKASEEAARAAREAERVRIAEVAGVDLSQAKRPRGRPRKAHAVKDRN
jgi:hypothetical protein